MNMKKSGLIGNPVNGMTQEDGSAYSYDLIEEDGFENAWEHFLNE